MSIIKTFPTLYKKTSTGKIQSWKICTQDNTIMSESGQVDGKKIKSSDTIQTGKNVGRANETTASEQAALEAESKWTSKKKKGYVESIASAEAGEVSALVDGGYTPMTALKYAESGKHIKFPCAAQPKLDGIRGVCDNGGELFARSRKKIISVPHIEAYLKEHSPYDRLDGELYNHDFKEDFETITHFVNQRKKPIPGHEIVQYHVYDVPEDLPFNERMLLLAEMKEKFDKDLNCPIVIVETVICADEEELIACRERWMDIGYEGAMARNLHGTYEHKRSKHLQKLKLMMDDEFEIIGVNEGRGKLAGHAGSFQCLTHEGAEFKAKLKGKLKDLKQYYKAPKEYIGKQLTVQFQGYTKANCKPRFPVALRFREDY